MALDDVLRAGQDYTNISMILEAHKEDAYNTDMFNSFLEYTQHTGEPLPEQELELMQDELGRNPMRLRQTIENSRETDRRNLVEVVSRNYKAAVNAVSNDSLVELAINIPDKDKDFDKIRRKIKQKDYKGAQRDYADTFDNRVWKQFMQTANTEFIVKYAERYIEVQKSKFLEKYTREVTRKGKKVKEIDYDKLRKYVKDTLGAYTKNEDKEDAYTMLGTSYFMSEVSKKKK